jgi:predicted PurR-regulated permease PerM
MYPSGPPIARGAAPVTPRPSAPRPRSAFQRITDGAWRALVLGLLVLAVVALLWKLQIVVLPVFIAMLLCSVLAPLVVRLEQRGWKTLAATWVVFLGFVAVVGGIVAAIVPATVGEFDGLGETVESGLDDVEDWLIDGPLNLRRSDVTAYTDDPGGRLAELARDSSEQVVSGVQMVGTTLAGLLLTLVLTFMFLKDGRRFQAWVLAHTPNRHRDVARAAGGRAWDALSGFLQGAATLGAIEATIIGLTLWLVGAPLVIPVALLTFLGAFFPIVGAVVAGALAVLVALAGGGFGEALIVLAVAVVVQQFDNDLLAPFIYGRTLQLHPAVILVVLSAGGVLGGIAGAFLAVPVSGAVAGALGEVWDRYGRRWVEDDRADHLAQVPGSLTPVGPASATSMGGEGGARP